MERELMQICTYLTPRVTETVAYYHANGAKIEEIRLRRDGMLSFTSEGKTLPTRVMLSAKEFETNFLSLTQYSLYTHTETLRAGFFQVAGGYRIGVCGKAILEDGCIRSLAAVDSLNIRIPYRPSGISGAVCHRLQEIFPTGGLIFSSPGGGKTTLLSDIALTLSGEPKFRRVSVIDSRGEICFGAVGAHALDVLHGYPKAMGMEIATRTLSPEYILCDEIGTGKEAEAMLGAMHAGVAVIATTHASSLQELFAKEWVVHMHAQHVFGAYIHITREHGGFQYRTVLAKEVLL